MKTMRLIYALILTCVRMGATAAFAPACHHHASLAPSLLCAQKDVKNEPSFLLQDFRTYNGEILNPYQVLDVPRAAEPSQIRASYMKLSRRYHPDSVRHKNILPGRCNNMDEVRDEWERIKLSYEILKDQRMRKKYDRHEALADPGAAVGRAALGAVGKGLSGVGKGLFDVGAFTFKKLTQKEGSEQEKRAP